MSRLIPALGPSDHLRGGLSAPVQLVEYGDFECPYCGQAYPIVKALEEALGDRLVVGFRNYPLVGSHPHAMAAAQAAEAAALQGLFWEMHDLLYENQRALTPTSLAGYAARLAIDPGRAADPRVREKIRGDLHSGARSGVNGTPCFFINGDRWDGSWDFDSLFLALSEVPGSGLRPE
jgi:protein-disulfide isomerase